MRIYTRKSSKHQSIWAKLARASDKLKQKQENGGHSNFASIILRKYKTLRCVYYYYDTGRDIGGYLRLTSYIQMFSAGLC